VLSPPPAPRRPAPPPAYLDAAAGLPLHPAARAALLAALDEGWADPGKLYGAGRRARMLLDGAREAVAAVLGARPDEVSFTPSGTLAAHLGVLGAAAGRARTGRHLVHSAVEHSCVLHAVDFTGAPATSVPVDHLGRVDAERYAAALRPDTALACLISASHEVGTVQPVEQVAQACAAAGVPLLVDASQTAGRAPVPAGWSLLVASAWKWGGPPGVGVLAVRTGTRYRSPLPADERQGERLPGTPALPAVLAAAVGLQAAAAEAAAEDARLRPLVDRLRREVPAAVPDLTAVGDPDDRLPHLVAFSSPYLDGEGLLRGLDREGLAVSSGSSCSASALEPSHVLAAMGLLSSGSLRVSLHRGTTAADVDRLLEVLPRVAAEQRGD
jgi:cysteine desulfurase